MSVLQMMLQQSCIHVVLGATKVPCTMYKISWYSKPTGSQEASHMLVTGLSYSHLSNCYMFMSLRHKMTRNLIMTEA